MQERTGIITFKGKPMTLLGPDVKPGDKAPDFRAVDNGLGPVTLADAAWAGGGARSRGAPATGS